MDKDLFKVTNEYSKVFTNILSGWSTILDELNELDELDEFESQDSELQECQLSEKNKSLHLINKIKEITDECQETICSDCMAHNHFCIKDKLLNDLKNIITDSDL